MRGGGAATVILVLVMRERLIRPRSDKAAHHMKGGPMGVEDLGEGGCGNGREL